MKLFTQYDYAKLLSNGKPENREQDHFPVVKLFTPDAGCTWILTELVDSETVFGLCDLGMGFPELGYVHIPELVALRGRFGLPVERDLYFKPKYRLSVYANAAYHYGRIVDCENSLKKFASY